MRQMLMRKLNPELSGELVEVNEVDKPRVTGPFDVVIKISASGVCRTDLHLINGLLPVGLPHVLGHENAGIVEETGSLVTTVSKGDSVICFPFISNGLTRTERQGLDTNAPNRITPGINAPGGYAEYLLTNEWKDKAGAYAIQGYAEKFIKRINGSYSNVVGLPLFETYNLLNSQGLI